MNKYTFKEQRRHGWQIKLCVFLIVLIFGGVVYFVQAHLGTSRIIIEGNKQQTEKNDATQTISMPLPDQEKKQMEKNNSGNSTDEALSSEQENTDADVNSEKKSDIQPLAYLTDKDQDLKNRLTEALANTKPQILTGKYIDISLSHQNIVIFEDSQILNAYLISSGKSGFNTPIGTFKIENKSPRAWSKDYSLWMPYWMSFLPTGKMGIHELPEWPGGYKEPATHLGTPVSHGCIRLGVGPAEQVYDWAEIGTPVIIHK